MLDANGFDGHALCIADASNITLHQVLLRGSCSWNTHIFRSRHVVVDGVKIFSGADGFDPDNSQDVSLRSVFVHSNDDAVVVKATTPGIPTERVTLDRAVLSTKKSCLKVGTESLATIQGVHFADVEAFNLDRGMVLYPYDGGGFDDIRWQRVRFSSFYPYADESKTGMVFDFEARDRSGLSRLGNISATDIVVDQVLAPSVFKGVPGARIQGVHFRNLTFRVGKPIKHRSAKPFLFDCTHMGHQYVDPINTTGFVVDWGPNREAWAGLQRGHCLELG